MLRARSFHQTHSVVLGEFLYAQSVTHAGHPIPKSQSLMNRPRKNGDRRLSSGPRWQDVLPQGIVPNLVGGMTALSFVHL